VTRPVKTVHVLAADDSAVMRLLLATLFAHGTVCGPGASLRIELCGLVGDGEACLSAVRALNPDLLLLDLEMPRMSGMAVLQQLHRERPRLPVIMCSAYTAHGAASTLEALASGAAEYVMKPSGAASSRDALATLEAQLLPKILALASRAEREAAEARGVAEARGAMGSSAMRRVMSGSGSASSSGLRSAAETRLFDAIGIGISTGGPAALEKLLPTLPADFPVPVLLVQHMPKLFTSALAERLDRCCAVKVRLAANGDTPRAGTVLLAPGDSHMEVMLGVQRRPAIRLSQGPLVNHTRPAVDPLFLSMATVYGSRALAVVMTGMGSDGLAGAIAIVNAGGLVLAQDEATSAVWGMPGRVASAGLAEVHSLERLTKVMARVNSTGAHAYSSPSRKGAIACGQQ
jgi:two-component system chemotaxis response regulator CheB